MKNTTGVVSPPRKTKMTRENPVFEDVFPIENGGFSNVVLALRGLRILCFSGRGWHEDGMNFFKHI